jgi:hypothetical protein
MTVLASKIAELLGVELRNGDTTVERPRALSRAEPGALVFANSCTLAIAARLNACGDCQRA